MKTEVQEKGNTVSGTRGRWGFRGIGRGRQNRETVECYKCRKLGNYRNECPDWDKEANYVEANEEDSMLLMAIQNLKKGKEKRRLGSWTLDALTT